jgi:uncharacterized membrane protein YagU involved in acid resistance
MMAGQGVKMFVKGHQELNLKPRSEDRSFSNAPAVALQLY